MQLWGTGVKALFLLAVVLASPVLGGTLLSTLILGVGIAIGLLVTSIALRPQHGLQFALPNQTDTIALDAHTMVSTGALDGTLRSVNDNFCNVLGYSRKDIIGRSVYQNFYFEEDLSTCLEIRKALEAGKNWSGELRLKAHDGSEVWTQTTAVPRRNWLGIIDSTIFVRTDITENKRAQSQEEILTTFDNLAEQVAMFTAYDGTLEYMNKSAKELFSLSYSDLGKIRMSETKLEYDIEHAQREVGDLLRKKVEFVDFVLDIEGTPYDVRVQRIDAIGREPMLIAFFRDRTDKDVLEREKAQFISTVSHELRTPLTSIKGAVELALSTNAGVSSAKAEKLLSIAQRNTDRLLLIVNDILDLEKIETELVAFDTKSISLKKLAHETIATNKPYLDDLNVSAKVVADTEDVHMDADPDRLTQVLTNLLSNAAKFSNAGDVININLWAKEDTVGFSVIDRGDGIPAVALDTIFERFRQVAGARQIGSASSGLGLAIVKTIVERHSGRVWIESQEGKGTSVHCQFPSGEGELGQNELITFS